MIRPHSLIPGATIGITCPSGYVAPDKITHAVATLESWGFNVKLGSTIGNEHFYFSGSDEERRADLQQMLDDDSIDAILMGRGGYGMSRIIDQLDFVGFLRNPKWICGFSDITVLHNHIQANYGITTIHSAMCGAFKPETAKAEYILSIRHLLTGVPVHYNLPPSPFNRAGSTEAPLTGGNVAILAHLTGSSSEVDTNGKILFIEDIGEYKYNLDRMLLNLKRAGKLDHLAALLVGSFTDMQDTERPFGKTVEEIIFEKVQEYDYPVCFNMPSGHQEINYAICLGATHSLDITAEGSLLKLL